jgi:hypothetical protein
MVGRNGTVILPETGFGFQSTEIEQGIDFYGGATVNKQ